MDAGRCHRRVRCHAEIDQVARCLQTGGAQPVRAPDPRAMSRPECSATVGAIMAETRTSSRQRCKPSGLRDARRTARERGVEGIAAGLKEHGRSLAGLWVSGGNRALGAHRLYALRRSAARAPAAVERLSGPRPAALRKMFGKPSADLGQHPRRRPLARFAAAVCIEKYDALTPHFVERNPSRKPRRPHLSHQ